MTLEISSSDPEAVKLLREIANAEPSNVMSIPISPMEGKDVFALVIENYFMLSMGTVALIAALKTKIGSIEVNKDGFKLVSAEEKQSALNGK